MNEAPAPSAATVVSYCVVWEEPQSNIGLVPVVTCKTFIDHGAANKFAEETALHYPGLVVKLHQEVGSYVAVMKVEMRKVGEGRAPSTLASSEAIDPEVV